MKTSNWSSSNYKVFDRQTDIEKNHKSPANTHGKLREKIVKELHDLGNRQTRSQINSEPKIWDKKDGYGNTYFRVYDPQSDRYIYFNSEDEVRWWLDKRYYL